MCRHVRHFGSTAVSWLTAKCRHLPAGGAGRARQFGTAAGTEALSAVRHCHGSRRWAVPSALVATRQRRGGSDLRRAELPNAPELRTAVQPERRRRGRRCYGADIDRGVKVAPGQVYQGDRRCRVQRTVLTGACLSEPCQIGPPAAAGLSQSLISSVAPVRRRLPSAPGGGRRAGCGKSDSAARGRFSTRRKSLTADALSDFYS